MAEQRRQLSHLDAEGRARMVDISQKQESVREAVARGRVSVSPATLALLKEAALPKGDVLTVAQVAGIMAAKRTAELIPMCHPIPLSGIDVRLWLSDEPPAVEIEARVRTKAATGVEMEALSAVSAAALTVYDMCKSAQRDMVIEGIRLISKTGGTRGDYVRPGESPPPQA
jgi:molybdenum cofactor biosynthesis protein MoaC